MILTLITFYVFIFYMAIFFIIDNDCAQKHNHTRLLHNSSIFVINRPYQTSYAQLTFQNDSLALFIQLRYFRDDFSFLRI